MKKVSVILLAGGVGSRMGSAIPKQFLPLGGKPIARHSFDVFHSLPEISEIVVVCDPQYQFIFENSTFASPGERRQDSVFNGLQAVSKDTEYICVHDSARPMINPEMVQRVIQAAEEHGAATVGMPIKFTVKESDGKGFVTNTPDRSRMWEVQTPQVIRHDLLIEGFHRVNRENLTVTDDVSVVELLGHPVKLVKGNYRNIKLTTLEDFTFLENQLQPAT